MFNPLPVTLIFACACACDAALRVRVPKMPHQPWSVPRCQTCLTPMVVRAVSTAMDTKGGECDDAERRARTEACQEGESSRL